MRSAETASSSPSNAYTRAAPPTDNVGHDERNHHHHHHPHQDVNQHSPSGAHNRAHSPHGAASAAAAAGSAVSRSPDVHHHGYGVSNTAAGAANSKQAFRLGFGVATVEDVLDERYVQNITTKAFFSRCTAA